MHLNIFLLLLITQYQLRIRNERPRKPPYSKFGANRSVFEKLSVVGSKVEITPLDNDEYLGLIICDSEQSALRTGVWMWQFCDTLYISK